MKLNEFMLVTSFLNWRPQIESWQGHWSSFVMLSIFLNFGVFFSFMFSNFLVHFTETLSTAISISS